MLCLWTTRKKTGKDKRPGHRSNYCEAPGGGEYYRNLEDKFRARFYVEYPLRPGMNKPVIPQKKGHRGQQ